MNKYVHIILLALILIVMQSGIAMAVENFHVVKEGDTLWDLSKKYGISVDSLKQNNHLTSDKLQIGMKLLINSSSAATSQKSQTITDANNVYIVGSGDNLWAIARNFNMTVEQIMSINSLTTDRLDVGDKIYISGRPNTAITSPSRAIYPQPAITPLPIAEPETDSNKPKSSEGVCQFGAKYLGTPYHYGGSSPSGFDCSGFVNFVFKQYGYSLPRTAASIYGVGVPVDKSSLQEGDLVFFQGPGASCINHVGIYAGNNQFIHSSSGKARGVTYSSLDGPYYSEYYAGAKRIFPE